MFFIHVASPLTHVAAATAVDKTPQPLSEKEINNG
jgi:hypothetical protein